MPEEAKSQTVNIQMWRQFGNNIVFISVYFSKPIAGSGSAKAYFNV
jgi:hypothetical protein